VFFIPCPAIVFGVLYLGYSWWADHHGAHGNVNHSAHFWGAAFGIACAIVVEPRVLPFFVDNLTSLPFR
jgi:hypothetical protein